MDDFTLVGHADNVPLALSLADLVIVPSTKPEAFGRSAAEASAMGVPVIAFDHGGAVETIACETEFKKTEATGLRVALKDVSALADAIEKITTMTPQARLQMGKNGRSRIKSHFSKQQMISKTIGVYERVLGL